jgi:hypothetical protein
MTCLLLPHERSKAELLDRPKTLMYVAHSTVHESNTNYLTTDYVGLGLNPRAAQLYRLLQAFYPGALEDSLTK